MMMACQGWKGHCGVRSCRCSVKKVQSQAQKVPEPYVYTHTSEKDVRVTTNFRFTDET